MPEPGQDDGPVMSCKEKDSTIYQTWPPEFRGCAECDISMTGHNDLQLLPLRPHGPCIGIPSAGCGFTVLKVVAQKLSFQENFHSLLAGEKQVGDIPLRGIPNLCCVRLCWSLPASMTFSTPRGMPRRGWTAQKGTFPALSASFRILAFLRGLVQRQWLLAPVSATSQRYLGSTLPKPRAAENALLRSGFVLILNPKPM